MLDNARFSAASRDYVPKTFIVDRSGRVITGSPNIDINEKKHLGGEMKMAVGCSLHRALGLYNAVILPF